MDVSLRQMEVFARVARVGSFTKAADELMVSQPVLSRTIRDIEHVLHARLLERTTRSVVPTAEGREFLAIAEDILGRYQAGLRRFAAYREGHHGSLVLAALPSIAASLLPEIVSGFLAVYPDVRISIMDVTTSEAVDHVLSGVADLAVTESDGTHPDLMTQQFCDDPMVAVLPSQHPLAVREELTWRDLAGEPFVAFDQGTSVRRLTDLGFARVGAHPARLLETRAVGTAAGMISAGLGVSAVPALVLPLMSFTVLETRALVAPSLTRHLSVLSHRSPSLAPPAAHFLAHVTESGSFGQ